MDTFHMSGGHVTTTPDSAHSLCFHSAVFCANVLNVVVATLAHVFGQRSSDRVQKEFLNHQNFSPIW